jgi:hypothetical protein
MKVDNCLNFKFKLFSITKVSTVPVFSSTLSYVSTMSQVKENVEDGNKSLTIKTNKVTEKYLDELVKTNIDMIKLFESCQLENTNKDENRTKKNEDKETAKSIAIGQFHIDMAKHMNDLKTSIDLHKAAEADSKEHANYQSMWYKVPFANMFFDMFFDSVPTEGELTSLLEQIGVLSALLLTVAMAIPMSISFDELTDARERFSIAPYNASVSFERSYKELFQGTAIATYSFAIAVTLTVMIYASSASGLETNFGDPKDPENPTNVVSKKLRKLWWNKMRYVVLLCTLSSLAGCASLTIAYNRLCYFKFLDYFVEKEKKAFGIMTPNSTFSFFRTLGFGAMVMLAGSLALISYTKFEMSNWVQVEYEKLGKHSLRQYLNLYGELEVKYNRTLPNKTDPSKNKNGEPIEKSIEKSIETFCEKTNTLIEDEWKKQKFVENFTKRIRTRKASVVRAATRLRRLSTLKAKNTVSVGPNGGQKE